MDKIIPMPERLKTLENLVVSMANVILASSKATAIELTPEEIKAINELEINLK